MHGRGKGIIHQSNESQGNSESAIVRTKTHDTHIIIGADMRRHLANYFVEIRHLLIYFILVMPFADFLGKYFT